MLGLSLVPFRFLPLVPIVPVLSLGRFLPVLSVRLLSLGGFLPVLPVRRLGRLRRLRRLRRLGERLPAALPRHGQLCALLHRRRLVLVQ